MFSLNTITKCFRLNTSIVLLNKSVSIAVEERGNNDIFFPASILTAYAWNSVPIDSTDVIRSIHAIGRALHFPLDINFNAVPKLIQNNAHTTLDYFNFTNSRRHFSSSILKILIEDRWTSHTERINNNKILVILKTGDIVMARTTIQSDLAKTKIVKLSSSVRGPY